jgi:hypothetical protein
LKDAGPLTYHLRCDYFCDQDRTLCFVPRKYITKMMDQFKNMYGCKPKEYTLPLETGDHLEIDTSKESDEKGIKKYQTMIGCLQRAVSIKTTLRYLGVTVIEKSYMFRANQAVITNSSIPHSSLSKRHTISSCSKNDSCKYPWLLFGRWQEQSS